MFVFSLFDNKKSDFEPPEMTQKQQFFQTLNTLDYLDMHLRCEKMASGVSNYYV